MLENALRYVDSPGTLKIDHEIEAGRLVIYFEDSGPGVPEESLGSLFDRLYRVDRARSRVRGGGSGLGLTICKGIVESSGGQIVCKPFSPREIVARVKAVLRRTYAPQAEKTLVAGKIRLLPETRQVLVDGHELRLTPCEHNLLQKLLQRPNRVFSRNELIHAVQGYDFDGYDRTIDSHVKNLRKKIGRFLPGEDVITTIYGMGYRLNAEPGE